MEKDSLSVVKIGGNVLDDPPALARFLNEFAGLDGHKILVHGGGKIATQIGARLGLEAQYVKGRRVTDAATLDLVTMVYGGLINRQLTARLQAQGCNAVGIAGADAGIFQASRRPAGEVDYGWVGDLTQEQVNAAQLKYLLDGGLTPVIAPLTHDNQGNLLNTNADTLAALTAIALAPLFRVRLLFCFEHRGVLQDIENRHSGFKKLDRAAYQQLIAQSALSGGIFPKLDNAFSAAAAGVERVVIGHAEDLRANTGDAEIPGTQIIS